MSQVLPYSDLDPPLTLMDVPASPRLGWFLLCGQLCFQVPSSDGLPLASARAAPPSLSCPAAAGPSHHSLLRAHAYFDYWLPFLGLFLSISIETKSVVLVGHLSTYARPSLTTTHQVTFLTLLACWLVNFLLFL